MILFGRMGGRLRYLRRVASAYLTSRESGQLSFWHETPALGEFNPTQLSGYYMSFREKADYTGPTDSNGVPLLDYRGHIGERYNPIAVAQYGLGNYNLWMLNQDQVRSQRWEHSALWLADSLERNLAGVHVWYHNFDWEYRDTLRAPWFSGLAQGQGVSLLIRAHETTGERRYIEAAQAAMGSMFKIIQEGGVIHVDQAGDPWIEEYIVDPPTHILNGFMWALWGVWDYYLATDDERAKDLWDRCVVTLKKNMHRYDLGWWSLYEQSGTRLRMIASPFYHRLHIVQLHVMEKLTGDAFFGDYARRWEGYTHSWFKRKRAFAQKVLFKVLYY